MAMFFDALNELLNGVSLEASLEFVKMENKVRRECYEEDLHRSEEGLKSLDKPQEWHAERISELRKKVEELIHDSNAGMIIGDEENALLSALEVRLGTYDLGEAELLAEASAAATPAELEIIKSNLLVEQRELRYLIAALNKSDALIDPILRHNKEAGAATAFGDPRNAGRLRGEIVELIAKVTRIELVGHPPLTVSVDLGYTLTPEGVDFSENYGFFWVEVGSPLVSHRFIFDSDGELFCYEDRGCLKHGDRVLVRRYLTNVDKDLTVVATL